MFIDYATIHVKAGKGGNGIISFRREKYIPKGGPDGGNGGKGGDVIIKVDKQLTTLMDYKYRRNYIARDGEDGMGSNKTGRSADDVILRVPPGTLITDTTTNEVLSDLVEPDAEVILVHGGKGGRGNVVFKSSTVQAPRKCEPGIEGEEREIQLELKLLADVGLVGFPNAGKSTLISRISAAKPKIADYAFTTLIPNLGIVYLDNGISFVVADMPGLIEGASDGKGLGIQFLRHIERTRVLVFLLPADSEDIKKEYKTLMHELKSYHEDMLLKPQIIAISKMDIADEETVKTIKKLKFGKGVTVVPISAVSGTGLKDLVATMWKVISKEKL
jgi:GTP-binding protein